MAIFDAYTAVTVGAEPAVLLELMEDFAIDGDSQKPRTAYRGFGNRVAWLGADGAEWASASWGGSHEVAMLETKGERCGELVQAVREKLPEHGCTRVDSAVDFLDAGSWERCLEVLLEVKRSYRLKGEKRGDWEDFPEDGRTLYLGGRTSAVRVRCYEKGRQPEYRFRERPDWVRLEAQVRPEGEGRRRYAHATPAEVWGASPFTRAIAGRLLALEVADLPVYERRRQNERDAALGWMCRQYGEHLLGLRGDLGSWAAVGERLSHIIADQGRFERRKRG